MSDTEKEEKIDYLEVDETIPGQNYVCLSFVSPDSLIDSNKIGEFIKLVLESHE